MSVFDYIDKSTNKRIATAPAMTDTQWQAFCRANAIEYINAYSALKEKYAAATSAEKTVLRLMLSNYIAGIISKSANLTPGASWHNAVAYESRRQYEVAHGQDRKSFWKEFVDGALSVWPVALLGMNIPAVNTAVQLAQTVAAIQAQPFAEVSAVTSDSATTTTTATTTTGTTVADVAALAKKYALPIAAVFILVILIGRL